MIGSGATNRALTGDIDGSVADRRRTIDAADRSGQTERMIFAHQTLGAGPMWTGAWEDARAALRTGLMLDPLHEHPYSAFTNAYGGSHGGDLYRGDHDSDERLS